MSERSVSSQININNLWKYKSAEIAETPLPENILRAKLRQNQARNTLEQIEDADEEDDDINNVEFSVDVHFDNIEAALQHRIEEADKYQVNKGQTPEFSAVRTILMASKKLSKVHEMLSKHNEPDFQSNMLWLTKADWELIATKRVAL